MEIKIIEAYKSLLDNHKQSLNSQWQSIEIDNRNPIIELRNIFLKFDGFENIISDLEPDLPWAENHFLERVNGEPINPGNEYKNWPYYTGIDNDCLFRENGKFSHNYMERYWCSGYKGIRYDYGDLNDIINRLKNNPESRQAFLSVWHPEDQKDNNVRIPCTIGYWFNKDGNNLNMTYLIRSCDAIRHFRNDIYMSYRLLEFVASKINLTAGSIDIWIGSFHCFKSDLYKIKKICAEYK
jgi:thymidylate synthase